MHLSTSRDFFDYFTNIESLLKLCFSLFAFTIFSCLFPTGFSATFSTLTIISALILLATRQIGDFNFYVPCIIALLIFTLLLFSVLWSEAPIIDSLVSLFEYRFYLIVPLLVYVLNGRNDMQYSILVASWLGMITALIFSFLLDANLIEIEGARFSLANRIFHTFIMSSLYLISLISARDNLGTVRAIHVVIGLLALYNVLNVEVGRTGYIIIVSVTLLFLYLSTSFKKFLFSVIIFIILLISAFFFLERFNERVIETAHNISFVISEDDLNSSAGHRLDWYRNAISIGWAHPILGVGVGDSEVVLQEQFDNGDMRYQTDNVHSEFMSMLIIAGWPGFSLFSMFIGSIIYLGYSHVKINKSVGHILIGMGVIVFVSAIFNSTVKDYGEKHALIVLLSLFLSMTTTGHAPRSDIRNKGWIWQIFKNMRI